MEAVVLKTFMSGSTLYKIGSIHDFDDEKYLELEKYKLVRAVTKTIITKHEKVSIVILVKDALKYTKECIKSIIANTENYELIIVDNGSGKETKDWLDGFNAIDYTLITNLENKGVSYGWNQAIKVARYDYICFINSDCIVSRGWLGELMKGFNYTQNVGLVGPSGNRYPTGQAKQFACSIKEITQESVNSIANILAREYEVCDIVAFCWVVKKKVFKDIGVFNYKKFPLACWEDVDFLRRAKIAGYKSVWVKGSFVYHYGNKTTIEMGIDPHNLRLKNRKVYREIIASGENYIENDVKLGKVKEIKGKIPILTITFDRLSYTKKAIEAIRENTKNYIHFIWDNGSTDGTPQWLKTIEDENTIINYSDKNTGLVYPMNMFFDKFSDYKYVAKVDNDSVMPKGWLNKLKEVMDAIPFFAVEANHYLMLRHDIDQNDDYYKHLFSVNFKGEKLYLWNAVGGTGVIIRRQMMDGLLKDTGGLGGWMKYQKERDFMSAFYTGVWMDRLDQIGTNKYKESDYPEYDELINRLRPRKTIASVKVDDKDFVKLRQKAKEWWVKYGKCSI